MGKKRSRTFIDCRRRKQRHQTEVQCIRTKDEFVSTANEEGYTFTIEELDAVLHESGDDFTTFGNPPARSIWWA